MKKRIIAIISCGIMALTSLCANAATLEVADGSAASLASVAPSTEIEPSTEVKPKIEIEGVATAKGTLLRFIGINAGEVDLIDFEVEITGTTVKDLKLFEETPEGRVFTTLVQETSGKQVLRCHWGRTKHDYYRGVSFESLYLDDSDALVTISTHVIACIAHDQPVSDIEDSMLEIRPNHPVNPEASDPMVSFIYAANSDAGIHIRTDNDDAVVVLAIYDEAGRMVSTQMKPVSGLEIDGKGFYLWTIKSNKLKAPSRAKVMLLDGSFCPLCEPDEVIIK